MNLARIHDCPSCRCGLPRCKECGYVLPDHDESMGLPIDQWCPHSPTRRAVIADLKKRGNYDPKDWK